MTCRVSSVGALVGHWWGSYQLPYKESNKILYNSIISLLERNVLRECTHITQMVASLLPPTPPADCTTLPHIW